MLTKTVTVENSVGLHARPATFFIQKANAKSLLGVLSLGITKGKEITIIADGADEKEAVDGLVDLILSGLNG